MTIPIKALLLADGEADALLLVQELRKAGFDPTAHIVHTEAAFIQALQTPTWEIILADEAQPHLSGLQALALVKTQGIDLPFILISASATIDLAVEALKAGAHDYLSKSNLQRLGPAVRREIQELRQRRAYQRSQEALQNSEANLRAVFNNPRQAFILADPHFRIQACNQLALDWIALHTGYIPQEGDNLLALALPEHKTGLYKYFTQTLAGHAQTTEVHILWYDQQDIWYEFAYTPMTLKTGQTTEISGVCISVINITERKKAEIARERYIAALRQAEQMSQEASVQRLHLEQAEVHMLELEKLNQLKDNFLSTISHELRTPLTNMRMGIHLLKSSPQQDKRYYDYLEILENECNREINLINNLLDLKDLDTPSHLLEPQTLYLEQWLPTLLLTFMPQAQEKQQNLTLQVQSIPVLVSDLESIERIMTELINNACKYTPSAGVIEVMLAPSTDPTYVVDLRVSNTGPGIPEVERSLIFERFYRGVRPDPWQQAGTGLGLALVKKLIAQLNGEILVTSSPGHTTFTVRLPNLDPD